MFSLWATQTPTQTRCTLCLKVVLHLRGKELGHSRPAYPVIGWGFTGTLTCRPFCLPPERAQGQPRSLLWKALSVQRNADCKGRVSYLQFTPVLHRPTVSMLPVHSGLSLIPQVSSWLQVMKRKKKRHQEVSGTSSSHLVKAIFPSVYGLSPNFKGRPHMEIGSLFPNDRK